MIKDMLMDRVSSTLVKLTAISAAFGYVRVEQGSGIRVSWAKLISKIFGESPTKCPRCGEEMKLTSFIFETSMLLRKVSGLSQAPPRIAIEKHRGVYQPSVLHDEVLQHEQQFDHSIVIQDVNFDQSMSW